MQNTSDSQLVLFNPPLRGKYMRLSRAIMLCALLACIALAVVAAAPSTAWAKSYDMTKVDITAQAETDGSLHAVEQRTFDFNGNFTAVWWTFSGLPANAELQVNSMRMARVGADGAVEGEWKTLPSVPFVLSWRDAGGPGIEAYSVDKPMNAVYAFFNVSDERLMIELDYTVINGVQAYEDVGEVYWKYIGSQWEEDSENVTMTLALPVPQGVEVVPGDNVLAWGHGPLDGTVTINPDGTVTYHNPHVNAGQYAEARVVFPVSWLTNLSPEALKAHQGESRLEQAKAEEQDWADQANRERTNALLLLIGCGVICVLLIAWALWSYFRYGREHKPDFTDEYWRDVPAPGVHPAVIGRLWRWNRESQNDFTATLMHLSHIGALRIDRGSYQEPKAFGRVETVEDYYFTRVPTVADAVTDPIDRATLDLLFDLIAGGTDSLWFNSIQKFGKDHPEPFLEAMKGWQGVVEAETNRHDYFEFKGKRYQGLLIGLGVAVFIIGLLTVAVLQNFLLLAFTLPTAIALIVIGNYMPRRSVKGNNLVAKCKALRNWLRDFSTLDERPPTDVKVWGEFMVYAYIFGIAKQVMSELQTKMPELFDGEAGAYGYGVPWWFWYSPLYGSHGQVMPSGGDLLQNAMANTVASAQAAISGASGNFSSGGGFGGGFSGGGGGGFGGGGGAR